MSRHRRASSPAWFWYRIAMAFGIILFWGGVGIFVLWFITRAEIWAWLGAYWIRYGLYLFLVGCLCLVCFRWAGRRDGVPPAHIRGAIQQAGCLLLSCFPAALVIIVMVIVLVLLWPDVFAPRGG